MNENIVKNKANILYIVLGGFFITNAIIAELIGVKIFSLEKTFGANPFKINIFGNNDLSFNLTTGIILWPFVFIITDIINEYFGKRGVKFLSYLAIGLILYAFAMFYVGIKLAPADFWVGSQHANGIADMNLAFRGIFGQGLWIIIGSLVAFGVGQIIDVSVFQYIKRKTGGSKIWLRSTGSTLISQFIDSFVVLIIAFYIGAGWELSLVLSIGLLNYTYKFFIAILFTPLLYLIHAVIEDLFLGKALAQQLKEQAIKNE